MTLEQMQAELERLQRENANLRTAKQAKMPALGMKVSDKGAVSVTGIGRFPVTLYAGQWERLFPIIPALQQFIIDNAAKVSRKDSAGDAAEKAVA